MRTGKLLAGEKEVIGEERGKKKAKAADNQALTG